MSNRETVLVHLASGIGNILLATPLIAVLTRNGFTVDVLLDADYRGVDELFREWSSLRRVYAVSGAPAPTSYDHVVAAIPPFYWRRFARRYAGMNVYRPADALFNENEQAYYLEFARFLGCSVSDAPKYFMPSRNREPTATIVLAPGSKPGEMKAKRWPFFAELAAAFDEVIVVGSNDDIRRFDGTVAHFPEHVLSFVGQLSLAETAALVASAAAVVANDCGIGHLAGALGAPTVLLFGPTPDRSLGTLPPNVIVLRAGLECEPCWFGARFRACRRQIHCLNHLSVNTVVETVRSIRRVGSTVAV